MDIKNIILSFILLISCFSFSQNDSINQNEYITKFSDKISTRLSLVNTSNSFHINAKNQGINYLLEPNKEDYIGVSILFRSIELDFGFAPKFLSTNKDNDDSKLFTLNLRMFHNKWMQTIDFYNQKGFSLIEGNNRFDLPDIKTLKIGGSTSYIFNKNFSFRAIGFQNEWQTKSAGSFLLRLYYYYTKYSFKNQGLNENAHSYDMAVGPAYYYNFVIHKNFLFSLGGSTGIGLNHSSNIGEEDLTSALYEFSGRAVLGYNSKTFYCGVNSSIIILKHNVDRITRQDDEIPFLEFYIGYRFNAPKRWIKSADNFNKKYDF